MDTETVTVSGNGTYTTPTGYTLPTTGTVTGTYQWVASYSGDANNNASRQHERQRAGDGQPGQPDAHHDRRPGRGAGQRRQADRLGHAGGGFNPTGTITFTLTLNGTTVDTETATVSGNGTYSTPTGFVPTGDRHLPVGRQLQRRRQQQPSRQRTGDGEPEGHKRPAVRRSPSAHPDRCDLQWSSEPHGGREHQQLPAVRARRDGQFSRRVGIRSAVYNSATNSVTLTTVHPINVHHLYEIKVTNPSPGGPNFVGILNRKFSLGAIVGHHGHVFVPRRTNVPGILNPEILPKVLTPSNRHAEQRLSRTPKARAFGPVNV